MQLTKSEKETLINKIGAVFQWLDQTEFGRRFCGSFFLKGESAYSQRNKNHFTGKWQQECSIQYGNHFFSGDLYSSESLLEIIQYATAMIEDKKRKLVGQHYQPEINEADAAIEKIKAVQAVFLELETDKTKAAARKAVQAAPANANSQDKALLPSILAGQQALNEKLDLLSNQVKIIQETQAMIQHQLAKKADATDTQKMNAQIESLDSAVSALTLHLQSVQMTSQPEKDQSLRAGTSLFK